MKPNELTGKVALVTGAARGIGEAIARAFATEGAHVVVTDLDGPGAGRIAASIGQESRRLDVREETEWRGAIDDVLAKHT